MPPKHGLTESEAAERLRSDGPNELPSTGPRSFLAGILEILREPMLLLLTATAAVYFVVGDYTEAVAIAFAIGLIIAIEFYQEAKTEKTLQALRDLSSPRALVVRDGVARRIAGREVVRGDVIILTEGDRVPADGLVLESFDLTIDESLLTGESYPVRKQNDDNLSAVFSGTLVVRGRGRAAVTATGVNTEFGKIGVSLTRIEPEKSPLSREVDRLVRAAALLAAVSCIGIAVFVGLKTSQWLRGILAGLALAISLIPEEFPVVFTIVMTLGAWRIARHHVLTRRIPAIEALGAATVLCADKTGTLTLNQMTVSEVFPGADLAAILTIAAEACGEPSADPMENAIRNAAMHVTPAAGPQETFVKEYALSPELLVMSRVYERSPENYFVAAKGSPETVFRLCKLDEQTHEAPRTAKQMAERGLRLLGVAHAVCVGGLPSDQREFPFEFDGLIAFEDPVRPDAPAAVAECKTAGVRVVMITGDYPVTAQSIARQIGLDNPEQFMTGTDLASLPDEELQHRIKGVNVFARVMPNQKLRLVQALKANGEIVAMTGDGVNDAPALKAAHIGVAMGKRGTDVAREAAALVLLNDDFSSIVEAIRLGRRIYDNLKKAFTYIVAIHVAIAGLAVIPVVAGLPMLLLPLHLVFLELIIDPTCSLAFESEPEDPNVMRRKPRHPKASLFDTNMIRLGLYQGVALFLVIVAIFTTSFYRNLDEADARAISFTTLVLGNLALIWSSRRSTHSLVHTIARPNRALWLITAGALMLLPVMLYVPPVQRLFQFSHLHVTDIAVCFGGAALAMLLFESIKLELRGA